MAARIDKAARTEALKAYVAPGGTAEQAGALVGVDGSTVAKWAVKEGMAKGRGRRHGQYDWAAEAKQMRANGMSYGTIAAHLGVTRMSAWRRVNKDG